MDTRIMTYVAEDTVEAYLRQCVDVERFLGYCRQCPNYTKRWSCPPFNFDVLVFWRRYTRIRLIFQKVEMPELAGKADAQSRDQAAAIRRRVKEEMLETQYALERAYPGSCALSAGSCWLCPSCARAAGAPCVHPELMRHSIEALGGDVGKTAKRYFDLELLWSKNGEVPSYSVLAAALLMK